MEPLYIHNEEVHNLTAPREVAPIIIELIRPKSVLDVGCGIGTWLKAFEENGINDFMGIDGSYVKKNLLKVSLSKFKEVDLTDSWSLNRKFDLVLCLEVAEHLPEIIADNLVEALTRHADTIIFSAAIPGQGGQNHLNEQWVQYWQEKFAIYGFYFHDLIRPKIWNNNRVDWWYRQNMFLVTQTHPETNDIVGPSVVHPELLIQKNQDDKDYFNSLIKGKQGLRISSRIFFNALIYKFTQVFRGDKK